MLEAINLSKTYTSAAIEDMLFRLNKEKGVTLIVVTHDKDLAAKCRRMIELKDGEIIADPM